MIDCAPMVSLISFSASDKLPGIGSEKIPIANCLVHNDYVCLSLCLCTDKQMLYPIQTLIRLPDFILPFVWFVLMNCRSTLDYYYYYYYYYYVASIYTLTISISLNLYSIEYIWFKFCFQLVPISILSLPSVDLLTVMYWLTDETR